MIKPEEIPQYTGNLELLEKAHGNLTKDAGHIRDTGADVHTHFQGLSAYYKAPEAERLFASTKPVKDRADGFADDLGKVSSALSEYTTEIRPLVTKLTQLKADATTFVNDNKDDDDWEYDGDKVDEHNQLRDDITSTVAAFWAAERTCHNKITALFGGTQMVAGDGSDRKNQYGFAADDLKNAKLPWGDPVEEKHHAWEIGHWVKSFVWDGVIVDGVWGTIKGLGTLVGCDGWDNMGKAWKGLAQLGTGLAISTIPGAREAFWSASDDQLPSWLRDSRNTMKQTGKALVAWDEWGKNPGRAAGAVTFNVVTTVFTGGAGGAAAGAGKAGAIAKVLSATGKVGRVIDPMTYVAKGAGAGLSKIGDIAKGLKGIGKIDVPELPEGTVTLPEGSLLSPDGIVHPPGTAVPEGAIKVPEGSVKLPDGGPVLPPDTIKLPGEGAPKYMDTEGNIYKADGTLDNDVRQAPPDTVDRPTNPTTGADTPRVDTPAQEPALVTAGARTADNAEHVIRLGDSAGDLNHVGNDIPGAGAGDNLPGGGDHLPTGHVGDNPPGGGAGGNHMPGGHAGDHLPGGSAHDLNHGPSASHEPPTGGHGDGPSNGGHHDEGGGAHNNHNDGPSGSEHEGPSGGYNDGPADPLDNTGGALDEHVNSLDHPPLEPASAVRPDGARYVAEPTEHSARVYDEIRATPDSVDLPAMSRNTGISESVLQRVKTHLFRTEHVVVTEKGVARKGLFTPRDDIGDLWQAAGQRKLTAAETVKLERLVAHEYVESRMMDAGLPYLLDRPQSWEPDMINGVQDGYYRNMPESWEDAGAHELSISERRGGFAQWERLGLDAPKIELAPDLSNIDDVVASAFQELRSKGIELK